MKKKAHIYVFVADGYSGLLIFEATNP